MTKATALREIPVLPDEIVQAGLNGELVLFVGAGFSMLSDLPSWRGFARKVLEELRSKRLLDFSELEQLDSLSPRTQLSIAKLLASEQKYALDLTKHFDSRGNVGIYDLLNDIGCVCVTTNYDELLVPRPIGKADGSTAPAKTVRICDKEDLLAKHLEIPGTVIHLHGAISKPETMVVSTKDYLEHYDHDNVRHFLGQLFEKKTVVFLGYGLEEAEVLEHILRRGRVARIQERKRFLLQGFFHSQQRLYEKLHEYFLASFSVELIGYVRDFENYEQQRAIIKAWASEIKVNKPALVGELARINEVLKDG